MKTEKRFKPGGCGLLFVRFPYSPGTINVIRRVLKGRWDRARKYWVVRDSTYARERLRNLGFISVNPALIPELSSKPAAESKLDKPWPIPKAPNVPKVFPVRMCGGPLRPYQDIGVKHIEAFKGRVLLADEMGLGKTVQALVWLATHNKLRPIVIVSPASLKYQWEAECRRWLENENGIAVIDGGPEKGSTWPTGEASVYIINYDVLSKWVPLLTAEEPAVVVGDEIHYIKNPKAIRSMAFTDLCKPVRHIIAMSGTPVLNNPIELWPALSILRPDIYQSKSSFGFRFCGPQVNDYTGALEYKGATNTKELHSLLTATCMVRRLKDDVLKDLPQKQRIGVPLPMNNEREYRDARDGVVRDAAGKVISKNKNVLTAVNSLRQLAALGTLPYAVEWIQNFIADSGRQLIVFGRHTAVLEALQTAIKGSALIYGGTSSTKRRKLVSEFTKGKIRVLIGEFTAMGVGLNLQTASDVAFVELPWTPGEMRQCEDRVHRIGQTAARVTIWLLYAKGSIHEKMAAVLDSKQNEATAVLDGNGLHRSRQLTLQKVLGLI